MYKFFHWQIQHCKNNSWKLLNFCKIALWVSADVYFGKDWRESDYIFRLFKKKSGQKHKHIDSSLASRSPKVISKQNWVKRWVQKGPGRKKVCELAGCVHTSHHITLEWSIEDLFVRSGRQDQLFSNLHQALLVKGFR